MGSLSGCQWAKRSPFSTGKGGFQIRFSQGEDHPLAGKRCELSILLTVLCLVKSKYLKDFFGRRGLILLVPGAHEAAHSLSPTWKLRLFAMHYGKPFRLNTLSGIW